MHTYYAKKKTWVWSLLPVSSARCPFCLSYSLRSSPMGLGTPTSSRKKQLSRTKKSVPPLGLKWLRHSVRTHNTENIANLMTSWHKIASVLRKKCLARDPPLLRPGDAQVLSEVLEANFELGTRGQIVSRLQYLEVVYGELVTDILGVTTQSLHSGTS